MFAPWAYALAEVAFAAVAWRRWKRFNDLAHDAQPATPEEAWDRCERVATALELSGPGEAAAWLRLWFHDAPLHDIWRSDLEELVAYALWFSDRCVNFDGLRCLGQWDSRLPLRADPAHGATLVRS